MIAKTAVRGRFVAIEKHYNMYPKMIIPQVTEPKKIQISRQVITFLSIVASGSTIININIESNCFMCLLFGKLRTIFHFTKSSCENSEKSAQDWEIIRNFAQFLRNDDRRNSYIVLVSGADGR